MDAAKALDASSELFVTSTSHHRRGLWGRAYGTIDE